MDLENKLKESVEKNTPEEIKNDKIFDYNNKESFTFRLTRELVEKLNLKTWFEGYKKEALVSTAGIRGPQNILYPHDTRFPINTIGITLATLAKALVLKEKYNNQELVKLVGCEVRYNSKIYLDIIARIQASLGIRTLTPVNRQTIPIWLASFLAFKLDLVGAEYITSSHGISVKNATKDLNNQGSQFLPDESIEFVNKIEEILNIAEEKGVYEINFSSSDDSLIDEKTMAKLNNGIDLYCGYLRKGVANEKNLETIRNAKNKIIIDSVGGCAYNTLSKILKQLKIQDKFDWFNIEEDSFFHCIGKDIKNGEFYDWSLDVTVGAKDSEGKNYFPVVNSLNYGEKLKNYPINTVVLITDPDHDRLNIVQVVSKDELDEIKLAGVDYIELDNDRLLCIFSANQAFLMIMDYWYKSIEKSNNTYFIVKTTASSKSWDEWAYANKIKVINTPVGFKEIAGAVKKIEAQYELKRDNITIYDVFNKKIELGNEPRMIFGGEESGGMIIGGIEPIYSKNNRLALAMREKSATEAILVASALISTLDCSLASHLHKIYDENNIISRYDTRVDIAYYNESEPDINKLKQSKVEGEKKRTQNDLFYLALAVAKYNGKLNLDKVKEILSSTFSDLDFSLLKDILFVGDGTYLDFRDMFVEIRPSGTDAKTKAYAGGCDREVLNKYATILGNYSGILNETYKKYLNEDYVTHSKEKSFEIYSNYTHKDEDKREFKVPEYKF